MAGGEDTERSRESSPIEESKSDRDPHRFADRRSFLPFLCHRFVAQAAACDSMSSYVIRFASMALARTRKFPFKRECSMTNGKRGGGDRISKFLEEHRRGVLMRPWSEEPAEPEGEH